MKLFIYLLTIFQFSYSFVFSQAKSEFLYSNLHAKTESEIKIRTSIINQFLIENYIDTNEVLFVPVYITHLQLINFIQSHNSDIVKDTMVNIISEMLIVSKDNFLPIGSSISCKNGGEYKYFVNANYRHLSTILCRNDDRLIEKSALNYNGIKSVLKRTKGQLIFIKIKKIEGLYYIKKNSSEITKL